jgi:8-oxo-dGTP pyrophosphatase MutT (NUDIX family)
MEYLMIRRKHTLGYIDFIRGKYSITNYVYLLNTFKQMTREEKVKIATLDFNSLWREIWGNDTVLSNQYRSEQYSSKEKFTALKNGGISSSLFIPQQEDMNNQQYNLEKFIKDSEEYETWEEPEWGFPKGRRNYQETDFECALREFNEETGVSTDLLHPIHNIYPFEETFTGSNYKSYKHKYYICHLPEEVIIDMNNFEPSEVSQMDWKTFEESIQCIRHYNLEKILLITKIDETLREYSRLYI